MGLNLQNNLSTEDIERVRLIRHPPAYDAGDFIDNLIEETKMQNSTKHCTLAHRVKGSMVQCPQCGSTLYFENIKGLKGNEDKCYECGYNKKHYEVIVVNDTKSSKVKAVLHDLVGLFKYFEH